MKTTLAILFNHPFPGNIEKLKAIYSGRFSDIVFLMPIVSVPDPAVHTVYRSGFGFHGHVADSLAFLKARGSDLYIFAQDDLLLHPTLTPESFCSAFDMGLHDGFIPIPVSFSGPDRASWPWNDRVLTRVNECGVLFSGGVENGWGFLPPLKEAEARFGRLGLAGLGNPKRHLRGRALKARVSAMISPLPKAVYDDVPYPLSVAFSDMFALRKEALDLVSHYFGVFAAMDVFVEVAIPTAMILGCASLATLNGTPWKISLDWTDRKVMAQAGTQSLSEVYETFDEQTLYRHPVKLSKVHL